MLPQGRIVCDGVLKWTFHVLQRMTTLLFPFLVQWVSFPYPVLSIPSQSSPFLYVFSIPCEGHCVLLYSDECRGKCDLYLAMLFPMMDGLFWYRSFQRHRDGSYLLYHQPYSHRCPAVWIVLLVVVVALYHCLLYASRCETQPTSQCIILSSLTSYMSLATRHVSPAFISLKGTWNSSQDTYAF